MAEDDHSNIGVKIAIIVCVASGLISFAALAWMIRESRCAAVECSARAVNVAPVPSH